MENNISDGQKTDQAAKPAAKNTLLDGAFGTPPVSASEKANASDSKAASSAATGGSRDAGLAEKSQLPGKSADTASSNSVPKADLDAGGINFSASAVPGGADAIPGNVGDLAIGLEAASNKLFGGLAGPANVAKDLAGGALEEVKEHPFRVAGDIAIGAGLTVGAALLSPLAVYGLAAAGIGYGAYEIAKNAGGWLDAAKTVANSSDHSAAQVAQAEATLKNVGAGATDIGAAFLGGGIVAPFSGEVADAISSAAGSLVKMAMAPAADVTDSAATAGATGAGSAALAALAKPAAVLDKTALTTAAADKPAAIVAADKPVTLPTPVQPSPGDQAAAQAANGTGADTGAGNAPAVKPGGDVASADKSVASTDKPAAAAPKDTASPAKDGSDAAAAAAKNSIVVDGITVTGDKSLGDLSKITATPQFQNWLSNVDRNFFNVKSIDIQSADWFGPNKLGFVKFKADVTDSAGKTLPGVVFLRGDSVAILPVLTTPDGQDYVAMTVQPRIAAGVKNNLEAPAGMADFNTGGSPTKLAGVAIKELQEELGLKINPEDLTSLGSIQPSPGATAETIKLYGYHVNVTPEQLASMNGKSTGVLEEGEQITTKVVPLSQLQDSSDGKTLALLAKWNALSPADKAKVAAAPFESVPPSSTV